MMKKMYLVLGDWSDDGHGKSDKILVESNCTVDGVQQAYKDSCKMTGVQFNHNENYSGLKSYLEIATDYEENTIPVEAVEIFREKFGLTKEIIEGWELDDEYEEGEPIHLNSDSIVNAWIWFVRLSHPEIIIQEVDVKDEIPCINGYWNKNLNVQFGYGLYY